VCRPNFRWNRHVVVGCCGELHGIAHSFLDPRVVAPNRENGYLLSQCVSLQPAEITAVVLTGNDSVS